MGVIELTDMPIATSGDHRQWRGVVSHTMDPATRRPPPSWCWAPRQG